MTLTSVRKRACAAVLTAAALMGIGTTPASADDDVTIADRALASCIRSALGVGADTPITREAMATLDELVCGPGVASLDGVQHASALTILELDGAWALTDLSPLSQLIGLEYLGLRGAAATDLSPVVGLANLEYLDLYESNAVSLPTMASLTRLAALDIGGTQIGDLSPLADAHALESLWADETDIESVAPLASLDQLTELVISDAALADLSPLRGLPRLQYIDVAGNSIRDVSPLSTLPSLTEWYAEDQVVDGGAVTRCVPFDPTGLVGFAGNTVTASSSSTYTFGAQRLLINSGEALLDFDDGKGFSGVVTYDDKPSPYDDDVCPWPSSFTAQAAVTGTAKEGARLTATLSMRNAPKEVSTDWVWRDAVSGDYLGSGATYTPDITDIGFKPRATATLWMFGMREKTVTSASTGPIVGAWPSAVTINFLNAPITGTEPDVTVRGLPATAPNPSFKYTWKIDGVTVATTDWGKSTAYVIPSSARGKKLSVAVSVKGTGYETKTYAGPSATILGTLGEVQRVYPLAGTVSAGHTVSIQAPTYSVTPSSRSYQWRRDGKAISGATSSTYKLTAADAGHQVSVAVTSKRSGYASSTWVSETRTVPYLFSTTPTPTLSGTPTVGYTLTASAGTWKPTPSSVSYRWYRDGKAISGATARTYKATSTDIGHKITVKTTAKRAGYTSTTRTSASKTIGRKLAAVTPTVTGTAKVGNTLTVKRGTWGPGTVSTKVQWYVSGKPVTGATGSTFRVRPTDAYRSITVKVTGSKAGYTTASRTSAVRKPVGIDYASCADMRKHYPDGVAKASTVIDMISGKRGGPITKATFVSPSLYALNDESDRDKDGWACEP